MIIRKSPTTHHYRLRNDATLNMLDIVTINEGVLNQSGRTVSFFSSCRRVARDSAGKQRLVAKQRMVAKHMVAKHSLRKAQGRSRHGLKV